MVLDLPTLGYKLSILMGSIPDLYQELLLLHWED